MHNQSSRTHAVLELEIVTRALLDACEAVIERQSELVPVAKRANGIYIEENVKGFMQTPEGKFVSNPDYQIDQTNIDAAEAKKKKKKNRVRTIRTKSRESRQQGSQILSPTMPQWKVSVCQSSRIGILPR